MEYPMRQKPYRYAYAYITVLTLLALLLAGILISVTNDLYAFVKPDAPITLHIDTPRDLRQVAQELDRFGVIRNPAIFEWYVRSKGATERIESFTGELFLNSTMSYREILLAFRGS